MVGDDTGTQKNATQNTESIMGWMYLKEEIVKSPLTR